MRLCFAPMDGITNAATRYITGKIFHKYGNDLDVFQTWTEFMNADGFVINPVGVVKHMLTIKDNYQKKPIAQIFSGRKNFLLKACDILKNEYFEDFSGIELNMGCPSNTVMKCGGGSDMLKHREESLDIIGALSSSLKGSGFTFSIKTRAGLNDEDKNQQFCFLKEISQYCDFITIHGRTLKQLYAGTSDWQFIKHVQSVVNIPVYANGGIGSYQIAKDIVDNYGFYGVMIGQGAIGNPWVFTDFIPSLDERIITIKEHVELMILCDMWFEKYGRALDSFHLIQPTIEMLYEMKKDISETFSYHAIVEFRKFLFCYVKCISNSRDWKHSILKISTYGDLLKAIDKLKLL